MTNLMAVPFSIHGLTVYLARNKWSPNDEHGNELTGMGRHLCKSQGIEEYDCRDLSSRFHAIS
jgi:hypothetical protein